MRTFVVGMVWIGTVLLSCQKRTPMKEGLSVFVGTWRWEVTIAPGTHGEPIDVILASDYPHSYKIKITEKGKMFWYEDGEQVKEMNLKIEATNCEYGVTYCYIVLEDTDEVERIEYSNYEGSTEKLNLTSDFPIKELYAESNIFVRE